MSVNVAPFLSPCVSSYVEYALSFKNSFLLPTFQYSDPQTWTGWSKKAPLCLVSISSAGLIPIIPSFVSDLLCDSGQNTSPLYLFSLPPVLTICLVFELFRARMGLSLPTHLPSAEPGEGDGEARRGQQWHRPSLGPFGTIDIQINKRKLQPFCDGFY